VRKITREGAGANPGSGDPPRSGASPGAGACSTSSHHWRSDSSPRGPAAIVRPAIANRRIGGRVVSSGGPAVRSSAVRRPRAPGLFDSWGFPTVGSDARAATPVQPQPPAGTNGWWSCVCPRLPEWRRSRVPAYCVAVTAHQYAHHGDSSARHSPQREGYGFATPRTTLKAVGPAPAVLPRVCGHNPSTSPSLPRRFGPSAREEFRRRARRRLRKAIQVVNSLISKLRGGLSQDFENSTGAIAAA